MEAKCKVCEEVFPKDKVVVTQEGIYCEEHTPDEFLLAAFTFHFSWKGANALMDYIDGSRDLEVLEIVEKIRAGMEKKIIAQIRSLLHGEISESDP